MTAIHPAFRGAAVGALFGLLIGCSGDNASDQIVVGAGGGTAPPPAPSESPVEEVLDLDGPSGNKRVAVNLNSDGTPSASSPNMQDAAYVFSGSSPDLQDPAFALPGGLQTVVGSPLFSADYYGAFAQDGPNANWTEGWTVGLNGNRTVWSPAQGGTLNGRTPSADGVCPAGTADVADHQIPDFLGSGSMDICQLERQYDTDGQTITLTNDNVYVPATGFPGSYIGNGDCEIGTAGCAPGDIVAVNLVIEQGTLFIGRPQEALIITRGSTIDVNGTAADPVVMTSRAQIDAWFSGGDGTSGRGEWAGLAIMGYAPTNQCAGIPCNVNAEGNIGFYGGDDDADGSGSIDYLLIRHAGNDIDGMGNELNGLTLFGTGSATELSFIQVHKGLDDGVEHFGGTDFMDHVVLTDNADDSFDWGQGWRGGAQFVVIKQAQDDGDHGIEADNDEVDNDALPRSEPTLANFTMIGQPAGQASANGILFRRGTGSYTWNFIVTGFRSSCLDIDNQATADQFGSTLTINNTLLWCPDGEDIADDGDVSAADIQNWFDSGANNIIEDPNLRPNGVPNPASGTSGGFQTTDYVGAYAQDFDDNWTEGWTVWLNGNETVWQAVPDVPVADGTCPVGTTDVGDQDLPGAAGGGQMDVCRLESRYATDGQVISLTNDNIYELATGFPGTYIGNGECEIGAAGCAANSIVSVTLEIEEGVLLLGSPQEALIITRGSRIEAGGTAARPIVMSSREWFDDWLATGDGISGRGEWAGLALMGYAQTNQCTSAPCNVNAEGNIGFYGGDDDGDDSGVMRYLVIRHAGNDIDGMGNELNGLTLFATGAGTESSFVQVHKGLDDGVEHFGAADFMDHIVLTGNADDSLDWGQGWRGGAQFVVVKQDIDDGDRGIEADNDENDNAATPVSNPTLVNMTFIGSAGGTVDPDTIGILLRRGTAATIANTVIEGFDICMNIVDDATFANFDDGTSSITNTFFDCEETWPGDDSGKPGSGGGGPTQETTEAVYLADNNNRQVDPAVDPATGMPTASSPDLQSSLYAFDASSPDLQDGTFALPGGLTTAFGQAFQTVNYIGAFNQDTQDNWTQGWTVGLNGNTTVWAPSNTPSTNGQCPAGTTLIGTKDVPATVGGGTMDLCQLASRYDTDGQVINLTSDNIYQLATGFPGTYVGDGECEIGMAGCAVDAASVANVTLEIEAGTLILGGPQEALIITRGSRIAANGTANDPIVMTSVDQYDAWLAGGPGTSGRGEWAGLALMGFGETNQCAGVPCNVNAEGNIGFYGGADDNDDSGILSYVVIRHAGNDIDGLGNELNGLTLFGTGSGTRSSYVQVHKGLDDGVEHFGATDFMDHIVLTDNADDSFDWGQGYRGGAQFVVIKQAVDDGDRAIEADNDEGDNDALPRSKPVLANFTIMGQNAGQADAGGVLLRRGTGAAIYNFIVVDFRNDCLDVDNAATQALFGTDLAIQNSILWCPSGVAIADDGDVAEADILAWFDAGANDDIRDPNIADNGVPNSVIGVGPEFASTDYIGAFAQDTADDWTAGWTVSLNGNTTVWEPASGGSLDGAVPAADGACPAGTTDIGDQDLSNLGGGSMDICELESRYDTDGQVVTLTNDNVYELAPGFPGTYIGNGECEIGTAGCADTDIVSVTLEIEQGTLILGEPQEALMVTRGSIIDAAGTAEDPIVMTSREQFDGVADATGDGTSGRGEWAGLALMGYAQTNQCASDPCNVNAEGNIGFYGGDDDSDSSGSLLYLVIRHAGNDIDGQGNELNGLTLFGTGSGTRSSFVQVHNGLDDGVEHFGGNDFMDHLVLTGNADDSLDWGQGWRGGAQFVVIVQAADDGDRGIEADNDENDGNAEPISEPSIANMTIVGADGGTPMVSDTIGVLLRRGTGAKIYNSIITGSDTCLRIDGAETFDRVAEGRLVLQSMVIDCGENFE